MRTELPTGTVTFLFTDIEGSTRLLHELGPKGYAQALADHRRLLRAAFADHGGVEVDTQGDAFFVAFGTAEGAAAAARMSQAVLSQGVVQVRIGLHTGAPTATEEGYVGIDVHRGARIATLAHGGQVVLSAATAELMNGAELVDLGTHRLKDFEGSTRLYQLGSGEFPPIRTTGSVELPTPATPFLGREHELVEAITVVLEHDPRVLTILGPGGVGKTRFAIQLGRLLADEAAGGTVFVPLAALRDPELLSSTLAQALGAVDASGGALAAAVRGRRTHIVLDNVEHLLPAAAITVAELVNVVPELRLYVTSREALRIQGEHELDLPPLMENEAIELFLTRARAVRPQLEHSSPVDELCRRLDRIPLALELAAARTKVLAPEVLLERLGGRLDLLRGSRDADPRHSTLRTTIAWSYDLLTRLEQRLFARLSVFASGSTLESAEAVCDADLSGLEALLDKSMLRRREGALGEDRFWMLETVREYASERLEQAGEGDAVRRRHAKRMLEIASSAHLSLETGIGTEPQNHKLVLAERDDVRAALDWAADHDLRLGLELVLVLENFWVAHSPEEGARRLGDLRRRLGVLPLELEARVLRLRGNHTTFEGEMEASIRCYEESLDAYRKLGDERGIAVLLGRLATQANQTGDHARARLLAEESLELARELEMLWVESIAVGTLGRAERAEGNLDAARELARRSAAIADESGFHWWQAIQLAELLELGLELGHLDEAERAGHEALHLSVAMENRWLTHWILTGLALLELAQNNLERAGRLWGAVTDERLSEPGTEDFVEFSAPLEAVTDPGFLAGVGEGRTSGLDWAIELVLPGDRSG